MILASMCHTKTNGLIARVHVNSVHRPQVANGHHVHVQCGDPGDLTCRTSWQVFEDVAIVGRTLDWIECKLP